MTTYQCRMPYCRDEIYNPWDVCEACWAYRLVELDRLPELFVRAYTRLEPGKAAVDITTVHVADVDPSVPLNLAVFDALQWALVSVYAWAAFAAELHGQHYTDVGRTSGQLLVGSIDILREYDSRFSTRMYSGDYVEELHRVYRRLTTLAGPAATRVIPAPCPHCDAMTLVSRNADEYAACLTCHNMWAHSRIPNLSNQPMEQAS